MKHQKKRFYTTIKLTGIDIYEKYMWIKSLGVFKW